MVLMPFFFRRTTETDEFLINSNRFALHYSNDFLPTRNDSAKNVFKVIRSCRLRFSEKQIKSIRFMFKTSVADFCFISSRDHFRSRAEIIVSFSFRHQNSHQTEIFFVFGADI